MVIASLARMVRDVGLAEELAQGAMVVALEKWPVSGVPDNPGAWLMAVAKRRAILLFKLGRHEEARAEFQRAASLTRNAREREVLLTRARACCSW